MKVAEQKESLRHWGTLSWKNQLPPKVFRFMLPCPRSRYRNGKMMEDFRSVQAEL